ncbi:MAG: hypothetical protein K9G71_13465 [Rhodobacteraceae bacterium]|jgi:hypothetical protein|nr:hypothetical protein [Paracoccaceae bacterium]MCF8515361.1 hypothetical protein [Paracoccaceae bacterium]MCF8519454.1 hypothetical protein [Paracoccaceae bacterium]
MSVHNPDFAARLDRIAAGGKNTRNTLFVGIDEAYVLPVKNGKIQKPRVSMIEVLAQPLAGVAALFMGMVAMIVIKVLHFQIFANAPVWGSALNAMALDIMLALLLCVVSGRLVFRDHAATLRSWQVLGVFFAAAGLHNLVHLLPGAFAVLFSENWVRTVLITTDIRTLIIGTISVPF